MSSQIEKNNSPSDSDQSLLHILVEWLNDNSKQATHQRDILAQEIEVQPIPQTPQEHDRRERLLGELASKQSLLSDLKGVIITYSTDASGQLDTVAPFED